MRLLIICISAFLMSACGDDSAKTPDQKVTSTDSKVSTDVQKSADGTSSGKNCAQVASCLMPCGTTATCIQDCIAKGCASAQTAISALSTCAVQKCTNDCLSGYSQKCDDCAKSACPTEYAACQNNAC